LTRDQFENSYIALQGDTAGLVESKAKERRVLIEKILQLEVLARAVDIQTLRCETAKNQVSAQGTVICDNELPFLKEARLCIENFQNARVIHSCVLHVQSFQIYVEQAITDRQKKQQNAESSVAAMQDGISSLEQQQGNHLSIMEEANKAYQRQEEQQKRHNEVQEIIAGIDGQLAQVNQDLQKFQDARQKAEQCADASVEYARTLEETGRIEKRRGHIPLVKKCYEDFVQEQKKLAALDRKLTGLADVDEELRKAKRQEDQCKQNKEEFARVDPTAAAHELWQKQNNKLENETEQNRQAVEQLTNRTDEARCPTCNQHYTEHTPEQRIQHLTTWLSETQPSLYQELQQQKRYLDEQKKLWEQTKFQTENEYIQLQKNVVAIEKKIVTRDEWNRQFNDLNTDFLAKQQAWIALAEDIPDPQEDTKLISKREELDKLLKVLKEKADAYALIPFYQQSQREKIQEQKELEAKQKDLLAQQRDLGYHPESYQKAKDFMEQLRRKEKEISDQLHQAGLNLQSTKGELEKAQKAVETLQGDHNRFCTYVQEYYKQEHLREHLEDFKKHFFEANTGEVMRRTTRLLMHAVTDQSILGVRFDKDELQYLDASNIAYPVSRLSGGEKALVGLCLRIALAEQAQAIVRTGRVKFLVLDEVLSSLDDERCDAVQRILADVQKRGIFEHIIMITHLDSVKQGWRASGLVVQKVDGKTSTIISVPPGEVPMDLAEELGV
jgi:DNA repair exonuclease SbcCD ATPase subunit